MRQSRIGTMWTAAWARRWPITWPRVRQCPARTPPRRVVGSGASPGSARLRASHFTPLAAYLLPTLAIGYGLVIPRSCIAGWNVLTVGFGTTVLGAGVTYIAGIRAVRRDTARRDPDAEA